MDEFDMITEGAFLIFQPIFAIILSTLTIIICTVIGLPIRLLPEVYNWWSRKPIIIFVFLSVGIILLLLSLNANLTETAKVTIDGEEKIKEIPNTYLVISGWFLTAFSLLDFYPKPIFTWFKNQILTMLKTKL